jgi:hypothetical protein
MMAAQNGSISPTLHAVAAATATATAESTANSCTLLTAEALKHAFWQSA